MARDQATASVLVVGDDGAERERLAEILVDTGCAVQTAATGAAALDLARAQARARANANERAGAGRRRRELVIADAVMPAMDGFELVRELRIEPATAAIPVLLSAANHLGVEARDLAAACGIAGIVSRPYDRAEVQAALAGALSQPPAPVAPLPADEFHRRHLQMLNARLLAKVDELRETALLVGALHAEVAAALARSGDPDSGLDRLSPREMEVLTMLGAGWSNREIAARLEIATSTVQSHVKKILHKLGARNRTEAAVRYLRG